MTVIVSSILTELRRLVPEAGEHLMAFNIGPSTDPGDPKPGPLVGWKWWREGSPRQYGEVYEDNGEDITAMAEKMAVDLSRAIAEEQTLAYP